MTPVIVARWIFLFAAISSLGVHGATGVLTRGPYLHGGSPSNIIVRWRTDVTEVGRVRFGTTAELFLFTDESAATTNHAVVLTNLTPDTVYFYSVGTAGSTLASGPD